MAGRAGRRGKDDRGASILCVDDSFGRVPDSDALTDMFDNRGKDLESKLKMTYKTNLSLLNSEGQDFDSLITNSFFSDETEKKRIQAIGLRKALLPRHQKVADIECECGVQDEIHVFHQNFLGLRRVNKDISKDCGLKPVVCHINLIFTPMHCMKHAIILAKAIQRNPN